MKYPDFLSSYVFKQLIYHIIYFYISSKKGILYPFLLENEITFRNYGFSNYNSANVNVIEIMFFPKGLGRKIK